MLKIVCIADPKNLSAELLNKLKSCPGVKLLTTVSPGKLALEALSKYQPDLVITSLTDAKLLMPAVRQNITASTRQGIQLVPVTDIYYFQAADKYVIAHHKHGELLINDAITNLEQEFNKNFVRVHRKTLVAIDKINGLIKNSQDQYVVQIGDIQLPVSRRQLPIVRKVLLC